MTGFANPFDAATSELPRASTTLLSMEVENGEACVLVVVDPYGPALPIVSVCMENSPGKWVESASTPAYGSGYLNDWVYLCSRAPEGGKEVCVEFDCQRHLIVVRDGWFGFSRRDPRRDLDHAPILVARP
jgi:hypothetical protein